MSRKEKGKLALRGLGFLLIFIVLLTGFTLIYLPKRSGNKDENAQPWGFYQEPENTIDVLGLGSCNLYSSFSPVLMYDKYGVTGYNFACPDEELSTSYYYLKEALKTQDIKVVMIESLFLTNTNSQKREHYNRLALDYFPLNMNKISLALETSKRESEHMKTYNPSSPDELLTFAGYMFPLLRYHSRTDIRRKDIAFFLKNRFYNYYKGGFPQYNYTANDDNFFDCVFNGNEINEMSRKYVPMIQDLCRDRGIRLIIIKSPNYARWGYDDTHTKIVRDFAEELDIPFVDFMADENNNFELYDYGEHTGRLNIYGMKKLSDTLGAYITGTLGLSPTELSDEDRAKWDECVERLYTTSAKNNCCLEPGKIAQLSCQDGAIRVRWNLCSDCSSYTVCRSTGESEIYLRIASHVQGEYYDDQNVEPGLKYNYYIVPEEGTMADQPSDTQSCAYVGMPGNFTAENADGNVLLTWEPVEEAFNYRIYRRAADDFNYQLYDYSFDAEYLDEHVKDGKLMYYRIVAVMRDGRKRYISMSTTDRTIAQTTPEITKITASDTIRIKWKPVYGQEEIQLWRKVGEDGEFRLFDTVSGKRTSYNNKKVEPGTEYFYKIVCVDTDFDYTGTSAESNIVSAVPKAA